MGRWFAMLLISPLLAGCAGRTQETVTPPPGMTAEDIAAGREHYHGVGGCVPCHGEAGTGTEEGPALDDQAWELGDGSFPWLVQMTKHAGWGMRDRGGDPQPMRGPTVLDSVQVRQVAAYVWSISRGPS